MIELDIWRAAQQVIERYGDGAELEAVQRADQLLDEGDLGGFQAWVRIVAAINELQKVAPSDKDMRH